MTRRKRYYMEDGYYDPAIEWAAIAPAAIGAGKAAGKAIRKVGEEAWGLTRGIRTRTLIPVRRGEKEPLLIRYSPWLRILIIVALWLAGIYAIRILLKNWVLGEAAWVLGLGVDFSLEKKKNEKGVEVTDVGQVLKNTFLNPMALIWTIIFLLLLANAIPEVRYE